MHHEIPTAGIARRLNNDSFDKNRFIDSHRCDLLDALREPVQHDRSERRWRGGFIHTYEDGSAIQREGGHIFCQAPVRAVARLKLPFQIELVCLVEQAVLRGVC